MTKVALIGGDYQTRSLIAEAQRCVNLYPEKNPEDASAPFTYYPTPGLTKRGQGINGVVRGLYTSSNNKLYAVIGTNVYYVDSNWGMNLLGTLNVSATNPVDMQDNSTTLVIVDGSTYGYTVDLISNAFAVLVDGTGSFVGATSVTYLDSFTLFNNPGTKQFYTTLSNSLLFDPTYYASKTTAPDQLMTVNVKGSEIWLFGQKTSEVWYNAGNAAFPFQEISGTGLAIGTIAKYSVAKDSDSFYFLSRDERGQTVVLMTKGYDTIKVSTFALENTWVTYTVDDAIGYTYQYGGHTYYVLTFPTSDATWVLDITMGQWFQWGWSDNAGTLHRHRSNCFASAYNKLVVGDYQNGAIYTLEKDVFTDNGDPIVHIRGFPHLGDDSKRVIYNQFIADMEVGNSPPGSPQDVSLRWSDTRGKSWGNPVLQTIGASGAFLTTIQWRRLGMARDRVFELSWSFPYFTAISGAYVDTTTCLT